ncbi:putative E3 ubiquitin-protein ligase XBAT35 isoform X3 [Physcomitrium patens]|uniref:putative E3 ubiquitin-protein ligase XBAT35 isoform X3 n=1 Tax=Physcomitrium patens TaxID=3218 RepID=UPI003CCCBF4A
MGNGTSKDEQFYHAVLCSNHNAVKSLRREGASLEWVDKEGRTPLILACTRCSLFEMVLLLLNLGANIKYYRHGTYGGYPLHHAAKRGLDKTVLLLLSRGADPLAVNDDSLTPLDMARNRGHVTVVRMIEERICTFSGVVRELSGPGFLEAIAPQWLTKKIWAVVLPTEIDPRRTLKFELVIYQSQKVSLWNGGNLSPSSHAARFYNVSLPHSVISLSKAEIEEPDLSSVDPVVIIMDKNTKTKYKFLAESEGDKAQFKQFLKACKGVSQAAPPSTRHRRAPQSALRGLTGLNRPTAQPQAQQSACASRATKCGSASQNLKNRSEVSEKATLKLAINASLHTATKKEIPVGHLINPDDLTDGNTDHSQYGGWGSANEARPGRVSELSKERADLSGVSEAPSSSTIFSPSAPPLPIHYPFIDIPPANLQNPVDAPSEEASASTSKAGEKGKKEKENRCVVCWDASAQGVCIPCGHLAGCMECLLKIKATNWGCPVCRSAIDQIIKVYAV